jgi:hypothetical protein
MEIGESTWGLRLEIDADPLVYLSRERERERERGGEGESDVSLGFERQRGRESLMRW